MFFVLFEHVSVRFHFADNSTKVSPPDDPASGHTWPFQVRAQSFVHIYVSRLTEPIFQLGFRSHLRLEHPESDTECQNWLHV